VTGQLNLYDGFQVGGRVWPDGGQWCWASWRGSEQASGDAETAATAREARDQADLRLATGFQDPYDAAIAAAQACA
jgi:hypothetical protein